MAVPGQLWVPPLAQTTPLIFIDESQNPEKSEIITFEAFWAKNAKIVNFDTFDQFLTWFSHVCQSTTSNFVKKCHFQTFRQFSRLSANDFWPLWTVEITDNPGLNWKYHQKRQNRQIWHFRDLQNTKFSRNWPKLTKSSILTISVRIHQGPRFP